MAPRVRELFLQLLLIVLRQSAQVTSDVVIEDGPSSLNISEKGEAAFQCVVSNAELVVWYLNDSNIDNIKNFVDCQYVAPIFNSSALEYHVFFEVDNFLATQLNNSHIKCGGIDLHPEYLQSNSSSALLRIQGLLGTPMNITSFISTNSVIVSWHPPFTFVGVNISWYQVNMTARNCNEIIAQETKISVSENISFPVIDNSTCTVYKASIQARTEAGLGEAGETDLVNKFEVPRKLETNEIDVQVLFMMDNVTLHFTIQEDICVGRQADTISATVNYTANTVSTGNLSAEANDEGQITFEVALPKSAKEAVVFTVITLTNRVGSTQSEPAEKTIVSVQGVTFTDHNGHVVFVKCHFAKFSEANGCYIMLDCISNSSIGHELNLSTQGSSDSSENGQFDCPQISCTTYNVYAYDIRDDGGIGVKAWSEVNRTLCTPLLSTSVALISPSTSKIPLPAGPGIAIIIIIVVVTIMMINVITGCVTFLIIWAHNKCTKPNKNNHTEDSVTGHSTHGMWPRLLRKRALDYNAN